MVGEGVGMCVTVGIAVDGAGVFVRLVPLEEIVLEVNDGRYQLDPPATLTMVIV